MPPSTRIASASSRLQIDGRRVAKPGQNAQPRRDAHRHRNQPQVPCWLRESLEQDTASDSLREPGRQETTRRARD
eukprot:8191764-Alexandrium_andersonii.AAC.1